jgi:predicted phosphodiesterase
MDRGVMRIQLMSDLHLERYPDFQPKAATGADVLVLAGDIGSYQSGSRLTDDDFGLARFSTLTPNAPWKHVLLVPGNHEFDGLEFDDTYQRLQAVCRRHGITWLEREAVTLGSVRFVGTTLWSDFDALVDPQAPLTKQLQVRDKAFRAANFYLRKNTTLKQGEPVLAEAIRDMALDCQTWLRQALSVPFEGSTVVVTHFAPTLQSADPRYGLMPGTAGFCNSHDDLLPLAQVWVHGHLHCPHDYQHRGCRVVANPRGYASKGEQAAFREDMVIEVA